MTDQKQLVEPRTLKGFQDLLPEDMLPRKAVIRTIEAVFERYGFQPLDSPAMEHLDVLMGTGGEDSNKELFRLKTPEDEPVALRFDLTVPFARLMAQYPDRLKPPFRRYAIGSVFRADKPGPGRFRQFTQFDIDAAGSDAVVVDAEIISIMCEVMVALGVPSFACCINNRKVIDALLIGNGIDDPDRQKHVLRVVDKLAKVGVGNIRLELGPGRIDASGDPIPGVKLDDKTIEALLAFIAIEADSRHGIVEKMEAALPAGEASHAAVAEMRELADALEALGVDEQHARFQPSLARGLDYYTGTVFEMVLPSAPEFGSVMGGGRYDGLVSRFLDRAIACTGMSVGLDRLMAALAHLNLVEQAKTTVQVLIVTLPGVPPAETLRLAAELRRAGINTEPYFGKKKGMKHQMAHADHYGIPVAVIVGGDELAQGVVSVKDLVAGKEERESIADRDAYREAGRTGQVTVKREDMVATVKEFLAR